VAASQTRLALGVVLAGPAIGAMAGSAYSADAGRTVELEASFAPGWRLEVDNSVGEVIVRGGEVDQVTGVARIEVEDADDEEQARQLLDDIDVEIESTPGGVTVRTRSPGWLSRRKAEFHVRVELDVPRQADLYVNLDVGRVEIESIRGSVRCEADVGELRLVDVDGAIEARTRVGRLEAELAAHNGRDPIIVESNIGEVEITLPADIQGHLDASANIGDVRSDFDVADDGFEWLGTSRKGPINGGGPTIRARTNIGKVRVRAAE
jgi:hypothetical protein